MILFNVQSREGLANRVLCGFNGRAESTGQNVVLCGESDRIQTMKVDNESEGDMVLVYYKGWCAGCIWF